MFKIMALLLLLLVASCGHLPEDPYPNYSQFNYRTMEFDANPNGETEKFLGVVNFSFKEGQELGDTFFKVYTIAEGTLYIKSRACRLDLALGFKGPITLNIKDLIPEPLKCSIDLIAETYKIKNREHRIIEIGAININVIPVKNDFIKFNYYNTSSAGIRSFFKEYNFKGQGSLQRPSGDLTTQEFINLETESNGGYFRVSGCGFSHEGIYTSKKFKVHLKDIYKKDYLDIKDSCGFEFIVLPEDLPKSFFGNFSLSMYGTQTVKLEPLSYEIIGSNIIFQGSDYILGIALDYDNFVIHNRMKVSYDENKIYWVRAITTNGRKSLYAVKKGLIVWRE